MTLHQFTSRYSTVRKVQVMGQEMYVIWENIRKCSSHWNVFVVE